MISFLLIIGSLLIQPLQDFPPLPTPTPWQAPTQVSVTEMSVEDTSDLIATTEAEQYNFDIDGEQVYFNGQAILPDLESSESLQLFAYMKWFSTGGTQSVLGQFAPLLISLGVLISLGFISLLVYFWENVIVSILKLAGFVINSILRLFGR